MIVITSNRFINCYRLQYLLTNYNAENARAYNLLNINTISMWYLKYIHRIVFKYYTLLFDIISIMLIISQIALMYICYAYVE
jgi:hypothetical protein